MDYKEKLKEALNSDNTDYEVVRWIEQNFPELKESEGERIRQALIRFHKSTIDVDGVKGEDILTWLEKQGEQKPAEEYNITGIGSKNAQGKLGEMIKNLKPINEVLEQKPAELPKGEDYGIDGLYAAIDILKKTLGEVEGYQTDDGILEHKCAISAVKELSKQQKPWSEEDEEALLRLTSFIEDWDKIAKGKKSIQECTLWSCNEYLAERLLNFLNSLRPQNWKPSKEQIIALRWVLNNVPYNKHKEEISGLLDQIKDL